MSTLYAQPWCQNPDVLYWMHHTLHANSIKQQQLCHTFAKARCNEKIIALMHHPYEHKPWSYYKKHFVTPKRIQQGKRYLRQHPQAFQSAMHRYHVPPSVIAAILGIETNYGHNMGKDSAMEALLTLGFCQKKRAQFFQKELSALVHLAHNDHFSLADIKSSYAGALGIPQFMPSNYHTLGIAFHKLAGLNLFDHQGDAIMSIGHFLAQHGWRAGGPIFHTSSKRHAAQALKYHPTHAKLPKHTRPDQLLGTYHPDDRETYQIYPNFQILMHYNHSAQYALAVALLAQAIARPKLQHHV